MVSSSRMVSFFVVCVMLQQGCGLPSAARLERPAPASRHIRTKRCSCNNWQDNECFYFCHLDIIWVNTPSKILPYGLGNPPTRRRRSASRCECLHAADESCRGFCHQSSEESRRDAVMTQSSSVDRSGLLAFFRSVVKSNTVIANGIRSSKKSPPEVQSNRSTR